MSSEKASDIEVALFLKGHLEAPCESGHGSVVRVYITEARRQLGIMTNPYAKEMLASAVKEAESKL